MATAAIAPIPIFTGTPNSTSSTAARATSCTAIQPVKLRMEVMTQSSSIRGPYLRLKKSVIVHSFISHNGFAKKNPAISRQMPEP